MNIHSATAGHWQTDPWMAFDTETTGVSVGRDRLVTAATLTRPGGAETADPDLAQTWLVNPGVPIPASATAIHGITDEDVHDRGQNPPSALEEIAEVLTAHWRLGFPVVIFNAGFDIPLIKAELQRNQLRSLDDRLGGNRPLVIDPLVLDRALDRFRRGQRTLANLCQHYGITVRGDAHDAVADSEMTLNLLGSLTKSYPDLAQMSLIDLQEFQADSHRQWAENLQQWHRKNGRNQTISTRWF